MSQMKYRKQEQASFLKKELLVLTLKKWATILFIAYGESQRAMWQLLRPEGELQPATSKEPGLSATQLQGQL